MKTTLGYKHSLIMSGAVLVVSCAGLTAIPALSAPITYTFAGTVSGSLNGQSFTNAEITFTATGDTTKVGPSALVPGGFVNPVSDPTFTLSGFGAGSLSGPYSVFVGIEGGYNVGPTVGLVDLNLPVANIYQEFSPAYEAYDLSTNLGPIPSDGIAYGGYYLPFGTTAGDLIISSFGTATFTATTDAVPEASTTVSFGLLLALGLGSMVIAAKKKKAGAIA